MEMTQKYREIEASVSKYEYQIGEDSKTLATISSLRKELGSTVQVRCRHVSLATGGRRLQKRQSDASRPGGQVSRVQL